ncbi:hypothetical protein H0H93_010319 [Arthromyces matolae]|nr:hypothetical protein H0H93_010319 [Arthromyces matolae]
MSDLNNTVGALFLGTVGSAFLYGFTSLQTYWYFHRWVRDPHVNKFAVALLWILDTLHLAFVIHAVYTYVATGFGNLPGLEKLLWYLRPSHSAFSIH